MAMVLLTNYQFAVKHIFPQHTIKERLYQIPKIASEREDSIENSPFRMDSSMREASNHF